MCYTWADSQFVGYQILISLNEIQINVWPSCNVWIISGFVVDILPVANKVKLQLQLAIVHFFTSKQNINSEGDQIVTPRWIVLICAKCGLF